MRWSQLQSKKAPSAIACPLQAATTGLGKVKTLISNLKPFLTMAAAFSGRRKRTESQLTLSSQEDNARENGFRFFGYAETELWVI